MQAPTSITWHVTLSSWLGLGYRRIKLSFLLLLRAQISIWLCAPADSLRLQDMRSLQAGNVFYTTGRC